jgi:hypothetical protein
MKKILFILVCLSVIANSCSSDEDNSETDSNVYFSFTFDGKNYSSIVDGGLLCMVAVPNQNNSKVDLLLNHNNPDDNTTTCGVTIGNVNNSIGTTNNCTFAFASGDYYITCYNTRVILTEIGDYYVGTFSGNINITDFSLYDRTISGTGSFKVRKSI